MIKTIEYAYQSSAIAQELSAPNGCYYVDIISDEMATDAIDRFGPYATIDAAQAKANEFAGLPLSRWSK